MRNVIALGRLKMTALTTVFSVISSALITFIILTILSDRDLMLGLSISVITPLIIPPLVSWYILGLLMQISKLETEQRKLATFDDLTGLLTRRAFYQSCRSLLELIKRNNATMTLTYIDIDSFKTINDTFGHAAGDETLKTFTSVINKLIRKSDLVARLGGDEFILALPYTGLEDSKVVIERIKKACENACVEYKNNSIKFTISIGVSSTALANDQSLHQLIKESDDALYEAKKLGKNCIVYFQDKQINSIVEQMPKAS